MRGRRLRQGIGGASRLDGEKDNKQATVQLLQDPDWLEEGYDHCRDRNDNLLSNSRWIWEASRADANVSRLRKSPRSFLLRISARANEASGALRVNDVGMAIGQRHRDGKASICETSAFNDELTLLAQKRNRGGWLSETSPRAEPTTIRRIWPMMRLSLCWYGQPPLATHGDQAVSSASSPINVSLDGENIEHLPLVLRAFIEVWIKLFGLQKFRRVCNSIGVH